MSNQKFKSLFPLVTLIIAVLLFPELTEAAETGDGEGMAQALRHLMNATEKSIANMKEAIGILNTQLD
ncbi:hypothetical protein ACFLT2_07415 [Acidobacteriota bacterium]